MRKLVWDEITRDRMQYLHPEEFEELYKQYDPSGYKKYKKEQMKKFETTLIEYGLKFHNFLKYFDAPCNVCKKTRSIYPAIKNSYCAHCGREIKGYNNILNTL